MRLYSAALLTTMTIFYGCAQHRTMRGTVAMKVSETDAHVCLNKDEVKVGDRVVAYYNDCQTKNMGNPHAGGSLCIKKRLGQGTVTKTLSEHYSLVRFDDGVRFSESTFIEK